MRLTAPAARNPRIDDDQLAEPCRELVRLDRVARSRPGDELRRLDLLLAAAERAVPRVEVDHCARIVAVVPQQPPQALGASHASVRDDENVGPDAGARRGRRELRGARQRMATAGSRRRGQVAVEVEERRAGDVRLEVEAPPRLRIGDVPAAVDEAVRHPGIST